MPSDLPELRIERARWVARLHLELPHTTARMTRSRKALVDDVQAQARVMLGARFTLTEVLDAMVEVASRDVDGIVSVLVRRADHGVQSSPTK